MKRKLVSPGEALQHVGLLAAFLLLIAANEFADTHPALMSVVVLIFSLPYLVASVVTRRAGFLYGTMLFGAVSYFFACHALGAPGASFPLLSVPLVVALLCVGHHLRKKLPAELAAFSITVFRAMNITVAVFAIWALVQVGGVIARPGFIRYVAGLAFLGYAGLYLVHSIAGAPSLCIYVFSTCLTLAGIFTVAAAAPLDVCWIPAIAAAAVILIVGTKFHGDRTDAWARHFYLSSAVAILVSLGLAMLRPSFLLIDLALGSLLLWAAYGWLSKSVPDLRRAMLADRVVAKCFFFGAMFLSALVAPMVLIWPADPYLAFAAVICGVTFSWVTWQRRDQVFGARGIYMLAAVMFASAGLLGLGRQLPGWLAPGWSFIGSLSLLLGLGLLYAPFQKAKSPVLARSPAKAAVFPAFFAWFIPVSQGEFAVALAAAAAAAAAVAVLATILRERQYLYALGPAIAGVLVAGPLLLAGPGQAAWITCAAAAAGAGACFLWADAWSRQVTRGAANQAWLILSIAAVAVAGIAGAAEPLWGVTTVGSTSALMSGLRKRHRKQDG